MEKYSLLQRYNKQNFKRLGKKNASPKKNQTNTLFYEEIGEEGIINFASLAGLTTGVDIKRIASCIKEAHTILEIGAGCGRAAKYIFDLMTSKTNLYLVENEKKLSKKLKLLFKNRASIITKDVKKITLRDLQYGKPNLALWMFSGIADFSWEEQKTTLLTLKACMDQNKRLIIDIPSSVSLSNATATIDYSIRGTDVVVLTDYNKKILKNPFNGYLLSDAGIKELAESTGWIIEKVEEYITPTVQRHRKQYFLR